MEKHSDVKLKNMTYYGGKVKTWIHRSKVVYKAGSVVTYKVDSGVTYSEEVDSGATCLSTKTFTPSKSGWTFVGWREDSEASGSVLSQKIMDDAPVTLYAVFEQAVTVTYYNGSASASSVSQKKYYNNGNVLNPKFSLSQAPLSGWETSGWGTSRDGNADIICYTISGMEIGESVTLYGLYHQIITCTFVSNGTQNVYGTRYYNSSGNVINASITVPDGITWRGWTWRGWAAAGNTNATAGVSYANGATISGLTGNATFYGLAYVNIILSYDANGGSGTTASQTMQKYYNAYGNYSNPTFTLRANKFTYGGLTFVKWAMGAAGGTQYAVGATVILTQSTVFYAVWVGTPYTWISNCRGSGATLTISGSATNTSISGLGYETLITLPTNIFSFKRRESDSNASFNLKTNAVPTNGCTTLTINVDYYEGSAGGSFTVYSSNGKVLYDLPKMYGEKNSAYLSNKITVDISSANAVYIAASGNMWPQTSPPRCVVTSAVFS